jgi:ribose 5-phosphate isomerase RpiB
LACRELVIQELPDYYWGLLSGADNELKRVNMKIINKINSNNYKYLDEFKEKTNELVKYVRKTMQDVEADFDKGTEIMKNSN